MAVSKLFAEAAVLMLSPPLRSYSLPGPKDDAMVPAIAGWSSAATEKTVMNKDSNRSMMPFKLYVSRWMILEFVRRSVT